MRRTSIALAVTVTASLLTVVPSAQNPDGTRLRTAPAGPAEPPRLRESEVGWRLAPADQKYAAIDGVHLKQLVADQTAICAATATAVTRSTGAASPGPPPTATTPSG